MRITIPNKGYSTSGVVGVDMKISVQTTQGRAVQGSVSFDDGLSITSFSAAQGLSGTFSVYLTPKKAGVWKLSANAVDGCGATDQTGLSRQVTVR